MQLKNTFFHIIFLFSFLFAFPQAPQRIIIPDSLFNKLKPHTAVAHEQLLLSNLTDTLYKTQSITMANCDTTASLNDSVSYLILDLYDSVKSCSNYFLVTVNVNTKSWISNKYLYSDFGNDISDESYTYHSWEIASSGHILIFEGTEYRLTPRQNFDEKGGVTRGYQDKKISLWIKQNGEIVKSQRYPR